MTTGGEVRIDPAAVAALYVAHADELRAFLIGILRNADSASEALQATFSKAMESGHTAQQESLKGWLFRVAFNEAMALRRRRKVQDESYRKLAWRRPGATETPEDALSRWEVVDRVRTALESLPDEQRIVVHKRIYEEKTFAVVAEELGVPLGTVLTRMRLALRKLQSRLNHLNEDGAAE